MVNIDFFFRACLSTLELLKKHEISKQGFVEIEGFFKYVALESGGEYIFNTIRSARGVTRDEWKRISLYATTKIENIRAEWYMDDISEFQGYNLKLAMLIFGDLVVHPECAEDYINAPTKLHNFIELCEFKLDFIMTMRNILNTFVSEMAQIKKTLPEKQEKFWAYTSEEERIVNEVEAQRSGLPINVLIQLKKLEADRKAREEREEQSKRQRQRQHKRTITVLAVIAVIIGLVLCLYYTRPTDNNAPTKPLNNQYNKNNQTATATATPKPALIYNGRKFITPDYSAVCPFEVEAGSAGDYYIYLKYQKSPSYSQESRTRLAGATAPYESDIAFIVKAGQSYELDVPIGVYKLYYATGDTFFNTSILFGDATRYYESDELLTFNASGNYYNGHTITLYTMYNGNFDTDEINERSFPTR